MYSKCSLVIMLFLDLCDVTPNFVVTVIICGARKSYERLFLYPEGVLWNCQNGILQLSEENRHASISGKAVNLTVCQKEYGALVLNFTITFHHLSNKYRMIFLNLKWH
jgi:hypothetical protein